MDLKKKIACIKKNKEEGSNCLERKREREKKIDNIALGLRDN